jgi:hypothetical protein
MAENTVTAEQLAAYLRRTRRAGAKTLSILGHFQPFMEAMQSPLGKEILNDAITVHEELLQKVGSLTATDDEKMEYKNLQKIIYRWSERIARYEKAMSELTKQ